MNTRLIRKTLTSSLVAVAWSTAGCSNPPASTPPPATPVTVPTAATEAFRNSADEVPAGWNGPVFKLSHNYPTTKPACGPEQAPWLKRNVSFTSKTPKWSEWSGYVQDIVDYVQKGQDPNLPDDIGWRTAIETAPGRTETRWFHIPWMAYQKHGGREFVHGLTNEVTADLNNIARRSNGMVPGAPGSAMFETWSVGMYNDCGAWAIGQAVPASGEPQVETVDGRSLVKGLPFPEGTVVMKLLNTTADGNDAPFLKGSTTWRANTHLMLEKNKTYDPCLRTPRTVHLIQIDLAVVDSRSPTRWVYSTVVYYYDEAKKDAPIFERLHPLGVQWGSDPDSFPAVAVKNPLVQSINAPLPHAPKSVFEHYGCNKRLAGPVDNPDSSCMTCHAGAFTAMPSVVDNQGKNIPAIFVPAATCAQGPTPANKAYLSNYAYPSHYPDPAFKDAIPLDTSLQLAVAFAQYANFKIKNTVPQSCPGT